METKYNKNILVRKIFNLPLGLNIAYDVVRVLFIFKLTKFYIKENNLTAKVSHIHWYPTQMAADLFSFKNRSLICLNKHK